MARLPKQRLRAPSALGLRLVECTQLVNQVEGRGSAKSCAHRQPQVSLVNDALRPRRRGYTQRRAEKILQRKPIRLPSICCLCDKVLLINSGWLFSICVLVGSGESPILPQGRTIVKKAAPFVVLAGIVLLRLPAEQPSAPCAIATGCAGSASATCHLRPASKLRTNSDPAQPPNAAQPPIAAIRSGSTRA